MRLLAKTLERCRIPADIVRIGADGPLPFLAESFDTVVIDAPCSGLGTVRRDPDIKWRRSPADLERFAGTQRAMMARAAGLVRRGGTLVYSTCSSEPEENADVVNAFLEARADYRLERQHETLPFRDGLEAFYGAVLRRVEL
jgi:16S rRNA (cytosine967-C5)-methyltransferase